jgi:hypothetical protein
MGTKALSSATIKRGAQSTLIRVSEATEGSTMKNTADGKIRPKRKSGPLSLHPLTPEEAIRRALSVPPPAKEDSKPKAKVKAVKKKAGRKKGSS